MMVWKEKYINLKVYKSIKISNILIQKFYHIVLSVEKVQKVKIQKLQGQKVEEEYFYQNVQCVIVKNWSLSKSKKLVDYWVA